MQEPPPPKKKKEREKTCSMTAFGNFAEDDASGMHGMVVIASSGFECLRGSRTVARCRTFLRGSSACVIYIMFANWSEVSNETLNRTFAYWTHIIQRRKFSL